MLLTEFYGVVSVPIILGFILRNRQVKILSVTFAFFSGFFRIEKIVIGLDSGVAKIEMKYKIFSSKQPLA